MKKLVSLFLVLVLALGMSTVAFAYDVADENDDDLGFSVLLNENGRVAGTDDMDLGDRARHRPNVLYRAKYPNRQRLYHYPCRRQPE